MLFSLQNFNLRRKLGIKRNIFFIEESGEYGQKQTEQTKQPKNCVKGMSLTCLEIKRDTAPSQKKKELKKKKNRKVQPGGTNNPGITWN